MHIKKIIKKYLSNWKHCKKCDLYVYKNTKCNC